MSNYQEARLWAAIIKGMEAEGIRPCKVQTMHDIMQDCYLVRIEHIPTGSVVSHYVMEHDMELPLDQMRTKVVDPLVMKMLEALT